MAANHTKGSREKTARKDIEHTPELPETDELHPEREDDYGAWDDHDSDFILRGRMP